MNIRFRMPLKVVSEANLREHWAAVSKRKNYQRGWAKNITASFIRDVVLPERMTVTLTRYGKRRMDDDNLANGFKAVRDGIADALGIDDGSNRIAWRYRQEVAKQYDVQVEIETLSLKGVFSEAYKLVKVSMGWQDLTVRKWFNTRNPILGGWTPLKMINSGKGEKLLTFIRESIDENMIGKDGAK